MCLLTTVAMVAFAANSLLCRAALAEGGIDPADFTAVRLLSGALVLAVVVRLQPAGRASTGNWPSASALFAYVSCFTFAYVALSAATGALLLFAAVQATMILQGMRQGERPGGRQLAGILLACAGVVALLAPGLEAPPPGAALLMLLAGVAWGIYSLRGRSGGDPARATAGNFLRAAMLAVPLAALLRDEGLPGHAGICYAIASGALASGGGYAIWYAVLPALKAASAATVQLSVPALVALGGVAFLGEPLGPRVVLSALAILGGIALVLPEPASSTPRGPSSVAGGS